MLSPMPSHLMILSVPGLRPRDISRATTPTLFHWANRGSMADLTPTFPCVTSCVQASMLTGTPPAQHGVIANGFYHRDRREVEMWTGWNDLVSAPQIWDWLREIGLTSAVWHAQNIIGAAADFIVTPAPIHEPDGTTKLWCYSKPETLYPQLLDALGHFPLQHYWGPLSNIESTRWILRAAAWLNARHSPGVQWIYIPHLDYASQKFGPNSDQAQAALIELDRELAAFVDRIDASRTGVDLAWLVTGEYALTDVTGVAYPNRLLREAGLLKVSEPNGVEMLDFEASTAFAMVDHQFAHVFVREDLPKQNRNLAIDGIRACFQDVPGLAGAYAGDDRLKVGMTHPRCGDVVLVCDDAHWLAYYWWLNDALAPPFARTVDIHRKPGYDPVELFLDPRSRSIPLDATLVKGSHGVPATSPNHQTVVLSSIPLQFPHAGPFRDTDVPGIMKRLLSSADASKWKP